MSAAADFLRARDFLLAHPTEYPAVRRDFHLPQLSEFNWALDHFDPMAAGNDNAGAVDRRGVGRRAPPLVRDACRTLEPGRELAARAGRAARRPRAAHARQRGRAVGDHARSDQARRGRDSRHQPPHARRSARSAHAGRGEARRRGIGQHREVRRPRRRLHAHRGRRTPHRMAATLPHRAPRRALSRPTARPARPIRCCCTSPREPRRSPSSLLHTHQSYPVGHLSTMYWIGLRPGDIHLNISSPGWAKHAWSCFFAPWNAGACVFIYNYARFNAKAMLGVLERCRVTTLCAPPTVWRMLIQEDSRRSAGASPFAS